MRLIIENVCINPSKKTGVRFEKKAKNIGQKFLSNGKIQKMDFKISKQYQNCDKTTGLLVKWTKNLKSRHIFDLTNCPWITNIEVDLGRIND